MRVTPAIASAPFLVLLLTWLSLHAINTDAEHFDLALGEIDNFETPCCMDQSMNAVIAGAIGLMRCGRNSGVPSPACDSGH
jgi:hypothetical protein